VSKKLHSKVQHSVITVKVDLHW